MACGRRSSSGYAADTAWSIPSQYKRLPSISVTRWGSIVRSTVSGSTDDAAAASMSCLLPRGDEYDIHTNTGQRGPGAQHAASTGEPMRRSTGSNGGGGGSSRRPTAPGPSRSGPPGGRPAPVPSPPVVASAATAADRTAYREERGMIASPLGPADVSEVHLLGHDLHLGGAAYDHRCIEAADVASIHRSRRVDWRKHHAAGSRGLDRAAALRAGPCGPRRDGRGGHLQAWLPPPVGARAGRGARGEPAHRAAGPRVARRGRRAAAPIVARLVRRGRTRDGRHQRAAELRPDGPLARTRAVVARARARGSPGHAGGS